MAEPKNEHVNVNPPTGLEDKPVAPKPAAPKASGNDANNAGPTPKQSKSDEKRVAVQKEAQEAVNNAPDGVTDPELIKDATSDSVQRNTVINRSHTVLFNDSQGNQVYSFHVGSNGFVNNITESQLRSILDKAGYELADVIDD